MEHRRGRRGRRNRWGASGGGAGAIPGIILGAEIGAAIGTAILWFLGIKFLAQYVYEHLDDSRKHFGNGVDSAWRSCGDPASIDLAATHFGKAIAELMSLIFQAAAAWVIKKGLKAGLEELPRARLGAFSLRMRRFSTGVKNSESPMPSSRAQGIGTTIEFFEKQIKDGHLDANKFTDEASLASHWKAMDFSKEIMPETLKAGKELVAYRDPASPYGYYYAEVGTYLDKLGVDYVTKTKAPEGGLVPREYVRFRVRKDVEVLKSTSSGVKAHDTLQPVAGGAVQYFIPRVGSSGSHSEDQEALTQICQTETRNTPRMI